MGRPIVNKTRLEAAVDSIKNLKAGQIAALLRRFKIGGRPATASICPIANLLKSQHGGQFLVGPKYIIRQCGSRIHKLPTPKGSVEFLQGFDRSRYPDLITPPPRVYPAKPRVRPFKKRGKRVVKNHPSKLVGRW